MKLLAFLGGVLLTTCALGALVGLWWIVQLVVRGWRGLDFVERLVIAVIVAGGIVFAWSVPWPWGFPMLEGK